MLRKLIATVALIIASVAAPAFAQTSGEAPMITTNATAKVNGVELHYDIVGNGTSLVLLHGGVNPSEMFGQTLNDMAKTHRVVAIQLRGHGL